MDLQQEGILNLTFGFTFLSSFKFQCWQLKIFDLRRERKERRKKEVPVADGPWSLLPSSLCERCFEACDSSASQQMAAGNWGCH